MKCLQLVSIQNWWEELLLFLTCICRLQLDMAYMCHMHHINGEAVTLSKYSEKIMLRYFWRMKFLVLPNYYTEENDTKTRKAE